MTEQTSKFEKLGLKELVAMGVGGMVGGGIFSVFMSRLIAWCRYSTRENPAY